MKGLQNGFRGCKKRENQIQEMFNQTLDDLEIISYENIACIRRRNR